MGVIQTLGAWGDKFRGPYVPTNVVKDWDNKQEKKDAHFQRLYDYYSGDEASIRDYIILSMKKSFKVSTIAKMQLPYFNIVRKIIDRLAMAYKLPANRYIVVPGKYKGLERRDNPQMKRANENYQTLLETSNINTQCKVWNRLAKLLDTIYVQPVWREDHIEYDVFPPHLLRVQEDPDNFLLPKVVIYDRIGPTGDLEHVVWSDEEHWVLDDNGKQVEGRNPWNGVNRYGVLPMLPLRLRETESHFGEGDTQLVDINEKICILLASTYFNAIMQSHGQAVAVNFDFKEGEELQTGPDKIVQVKNVTKDMVLPEFKYAQPEPAIEACLAQINWMAKTAATMRGLPASAISMDLRAESGEAKGMDHWELMELRADDIEWLRPFEKKLFDLSRIIWNYHAPSDKKIDREAQFGIDFPEPKEPVSELLELEAKLIKYKLGLWTPVDDMVDEDEGITEDLALQMLQKNLSYREELGANEKAVRPDQAGLGAGGSAADPNGRDQGGNNPGEPGRTSEQMVSRGRARQSLSSLE